MTGLLQQPLQSLQHYRPYLEGFVWGIVLMVIILFCFGSILQTRKRDDYDQIDDEYDIDEYRKNKEKMGL